MKKLILIVALLVNGSVSAQTWRGDNGDGAFSNPLFYDGLSDPDPIRVGEDYYLTGTTMRSMPGLPVLHSKDLVNCKFLGYAFDCLDLITTNRNYVLPPECPTTNAIAPSIRHLRSGSRR